MSSKHLTKGTRRVTLWIGVAVTALSVAPAAQARTSEPEPQDAPVAVDDSFDVHRGWTAVPLDVLANDNADVEAYDSIGGYYAADTDGFEITEVRDDLIFINVADTAALGPRTFTYDFYDYDYDTETGQYSTMATVTLNVVDTPFPDTAADDLTQAGPLRPWQVRSFDLAQNDPAHQASPLRVASCTPPRENSEGFPRPKVTISGAGIAVRVYPQGTGHYGEYYVARFFCTMTDGTHLSRPTPVSYRVQPWRHLKLGQAGPGKYKIANPNKDAVAYVKMRDRWTPSKKGPYSDLIRLEPGEKRVFKAHAPAVDTRNFIEVDGTAHYVHTNGLINQKK